MNGLIVVSCGRAKRSEPSPARQLYTGTYFRLSWEAATALNPSRGIFIVSAKHGLVHPDTVLAPYNLKMGDPGSVTSGTLIRQAMQLGIYQERRAVIFAGAAYIARLRGVWPDALTPLQRTAAARLLGHQMQLLKAIARTGDLWARS